MFINKLIIIILFFLLGIAVIFTRISRVEMKYSRVQEITEKKFWEKITNNDPADPEIAEFLKSSSLKFAETLYLPSDIILKVISLGRQKFLSDLIFVRAQSYFLSHFFSDKNFQWLDDYVKAIIALDPENPRIYLWASQVVKFSSFIDNSIIKKSNDYALMGIKIFPGEWKFYLEIGFNLYFEWTAKDGEEKSLVRDRALHYFSMAADLPGSQLDPNFIAELYLRKNETRLALLYMYEKYYEASEHEKVELLKRIELIEKGASKELKKEEEAWKKNFPYISIHLFAHTGEKIALHKPVFLDEVGSVLQEYEAKKQ
jgi:hypothetical protein